MKKIWLALGAVLIAAPIVAYGANDTLVTVIDGTTSSNQLVIGGSTGNVNTSYATGGMLQVVPSLQTSGTGIVRNWMEAGSITDGAGNGIGSVGVSAFNGATWDRVRAGVALDAIVAAGFLAVQPFLFNGTNWDRPRGVGSSSTVGTGVARHQIEEGYLSSLNVAAATTVKATAGRVFKISVVVAGAVGQLCDVNGACAAANVVGTIPAVVGVYDFNWPMLAGIRVEPGAAQVIAISWQ